AVARVPVTELLERLGNAPVHAGAPGHPEVLVERVLDESVHERERPRATRAFRDERRGLRLLEQVEQVVLVLAERLAQQGEVEVAADDRRRGECACGIASE